MDFDYIKEYITDFDSIKSNFIEVAKDCFTFNGTLNRTKFWTYSLLLTVINVLANSLVGFIFRGSLIGQIISGIIGLAIFVIQIGPCMRRLRDAGKNPYYVFCIVPGFIFCCIPPFIPLIFCCYKTVGEEEPAPTTSTPTDQPAEQPAQGEQKPPENNQ